MFKYLPMLVYILSTALSLVVINQFEINMSPSLVAFISFLLCYLFFNIINFTRIKASHSVLFYRPFDFLAINVVTAVIWLGTFWGLEFISPGIFVSIIILGLILHESLMVISFSKNIFYGFLLAVLAGFFSSFYINYSEKLQKKFNLKAIDLLCI